jgi:hypothetical protein
MSSYKLCIRKTSSPHLVTAARQKEHASDAHADMAAQTVLGHVSNAHAGMVPCLLSHAFADASCGGVHAR